MNAEGEGQNVVAQPVVLTIDVGGSNIKIKTSAADAQERKSPSGPDMTALQMVDVVHTMAKDLAYDVVSIGYPGPVGNNRPLIEPANLGPGWAGHDFSTSFGKPVKMVNDALMQAIGSYNGGRMLFLGLGTGLGAAMILESVAHPLELAHMPYRKEQSFEDYVGERGLDARGKKKWSASVFEVVEILRAAMLPDDIVIGGGNVKKLETLPDGCRRGDNRRAFDGGFRLWHDLKLVV